MKIAGRSCYPTLHSLALLALARANAVSKFWLPALSWLITPAAALATGGALSVVPEAARAVYFIRRWRNRPFGRLFARPY